MGGLALLLALVLGLVRQTSLAQSTDPADACTGIFITYNHLTRKEIAPRSMVPKPFAFTATATITNLDSVTLKSWVLTVGLPNGTILVGLDGGAVLAAGSSLPAVVGPAGAALAGFPTTDLKTAIETAGDKNQMRIQIAITGTQFGSAFMPRTLSLSNPGYVCPTAARRDNTTSVCCVRDPTFKPNATLLDEGFLPRRRGDLSLTYDVIQSHESNYLALVTLSSQSPVARLDNWRLSWDWKRGEFISAMRGAYPSITDPSECIYGPQGQFYHGLDLSKMVSCERSPTFLDLPLSMANDTELGRIQGCCRNGTLLPAAVDPAMTMSSFQLQVYKMPPDLNRTTLLPPQNWRVSGAPGLVNPTYVCGPPVRVSPSEFPAEGGLQAVTTAIATWQVVCNITRPKGTSPACCVSFSAFYNDSAVPCRTCACGCPTAAAAAASCNATAPAMLLPPEALLVPFEKRAAMARAWAELKRLPAPLPPPCGDGCGVSINWHVATDYRNGWTARVTLFNWDAASQADWFLATRLDEGFAGFETAYSFNATAIDDGSNTIMMKGLPGLNYLIGETAEGNPGKQQSVLSFSKRLTPGFDMGKGHGFPTRVVFNGEECAMPGVFPTSRAAPRSAPARVWLATLLALALLFFLT